MLLENRQVQIISHGSVVAVKLLLEFVGSNGVGDGGRDLVGATCRVSRERIRAVKLCGVQLTDSYPVHEALSGRG